MRTTLRRLARGSWLVLGGIAITACGGGGGGGNGGSTTGATSGTTSEVGGAGTTTTGSATGSTATGSGGDGGSGPAAATCDAPVSLDFGAAPVTVTLLDAAHGDLPCADATLTGPAPTAFVTFTVPANSSGVLLARPNDGDAQVFLVDRTACADTCGATAGGSPGGTARLSFGLSGMPTTHRVEVRTTGKDGSQVVLSSLRHDGTAGSGTCPSPTPLAPNDYINVQTVSEQASLPGNTCAMVGTTFGPCSYNIYSVDIPALATTTIDASCNTCTPAIGPDPGQCADWAAWFGQYRDFSKVDAYKNAMTVTNSGATPLRYVVYLESLGGVEYGPYTVSTSTH